MDIFAVAAGVSAPLLAAIGAMWLKLNGKDKEIRRLNKLLSHTKDAWIAREQEIQSTLSGLDDTRKMGDTHDN